MTTEEAIKNIKERHCTQNHYCTDGCMHGKENCEYSLAVAALEKQIPKKPIEHKIFYGADYTCPNCKNYVGSYSVAIERLGRNDKLCDNCGQAIDWSEV